MRRCTHSRERPDFRRKPGSRAWAWAWLVWVASGLAATPDTPVVPPAMPTPNHVLELRGSGAYAELPLIPFTSLTNATIECWVCWDEFGSIRRVFNYGQPRRDISLCSRNDNGLGFVISDPREGWQWVEAADVLRAGEWHHVAAIAGGEGMRLVLDGVALEPLNRYARGFSQVAPDGPAYLGKSVTEVDREPIFKGLIDEFRVWNYVRTLEEIRRDRFRRVTRDEPGLVFAATFEPEAEAQPVEDGGGVRLRGEARVVLEEVPGPEAVKAYAVVTGQVRDEGGGPVAGALVLAVAERRKVAAAATGRDGSFRLRFRLAAPGTVRLDARHWRGICPEGPEVSVEPGATVGVGTLPAGTGRGGAPARRQLALPGSSPFSDGIGGSSGPGGGGGVAAASRAGRGAGVPAAGSAPGRDQLRGGLAGGVLPDPLVAVRVPAHGAEPPVLRVDQRAGGGDELGPAGVEPAHAALAGPAGGVGVAPVPATL
ncbi:MAG: hypothetical protein M5U12_23145 [Verrucomicrobia bacterium]|nr:hypothetical protein [Verrucomicrobiota bacterium]